MNGRLEELAVTGSYPKDLIAKLEQAQCLLSVVYYVAGIYGLTEIESQMSCADSCIDEALREMRIPPLRLNYPHY